MAKERQGTHSSWTHVLSALPAPAALVDPEGRYKFLHEGDAEDAVLDATLLGQTDLDGCGEEAGVCRRKKHYEQVMSARAPLCFEEEILTARGNRRHLLWLCIPVGGAEGEVERVAVIGFDVSDRYLREASSEQRTGQLLPDNHVELVDRIVQELRFPLAALVGLASPLARKLSGEPGEMALLIDQGGRELLQRLDALLEHVRSGNAS